MSTPRQYEGTYHPIESYGAIGNLHTVVLVNLDGGIDWACLPEVDGPATFAALLDSRKGGTFRVAPQEYSGSEQRYLPGTNVLETTFRTQDGGELLVTDFMPLHGDIEGPQDPKGPPEIHRLLRAKGTSVRVEVMWRPRFSFAQVKTTVALVPGGAFAHSPLERSVLGGVPLEGTVSEGLGGGSFQASFTLQPGEELALVHRYGEDTVDAGVGRSRELLDETVDAWRAWSSKAKPTDWAGEWAPLVERSALTLKMLTHADAGAVIAAPTTSLPEEIGGIRNWDYRYCWIRDAALTVHALLALDYTTEARAFVNWAEKVAQEDASHNHVLRLVYGIHGETEIPEMSLEHFEGYKGSRPARVGNGIAGVWQHDTYGSLISSAYELLANGEELEDHALEFLPHLADAAADKWREPDYGIWEFRNGPFHFVHSKWMVWVALDRAVRLAQHGFISGNIDRWREEREAVRQDVLEKGFDEELNSFVIHYGSKEPDAANLLMPMMGFLPIDDPRVQGTIAYTKERLLENGLVYRYLMDDGLQGEEGTFVLCTFWLIEALALSGRVDEASELFAGLAGRANHLGLFSEEIDAGSGEYLGNFPQGFSHIGLINSALRIAEAEGKEVPYTRGLGNGEDPLSHKTDDTRNDRKEMTHMNGALGKKVWAIAEGYIPTYSNGPEPEMTSHETACLLNTGDSDANVQITVYFSDREPAGPYRVTVPAQRTVHLRFNELNDPEPVPKGKDFASVIRSDLPIVVQHTRLDSRQAQNALLSTIAYSE